MSSRDTKNIAGITVARTKHCCWEYEMLLNLNQKTWQRNDFDSNESTNLHILSTVPMQTHFTSTRACSKSVTIPWILWSLKGWKQQLAPAKRFRQLHQSHSEILSFCWPGHSHPKGFPANEAFPYSQVAQTWWVELSSEFKDTVILLKSRVLGQHAAIQLCQPPSTLHATGASQSWSREPPWLALELLGWCDVHKPKIDDKLVGHVPTPPPAQARSSCAIMVQQPLQPLLLLGYF